MTNILLISEDFYKENTNIDNNIYGKFLLPAVRESQDIYLQSVIGTNLYKTILSMVENGTIRDTENKAYLDLVERYIQPYLCYITTVNLIPVIATKLANMGAIISNDEHIVNLSKNDRDSLEKHYQYIADFYCRQLQDYLCANHSLFKELTNSKVDEIKTNLYSSATCSIWLGGRRGKGY